MTMLATRFARAYWISSSADVATKPHHRGAQLVGKLEVGSKLALVLGRLAPPPAAGRLDVHDHQFTL